MLDTLSDFFQAAASRINAFLLYLFGSRNERVLNSLTPVVTRIGALEPRFEAMSDAELRDCTPKLRERLKKGETLDDLLPEAFAAVREASKRTIGLRHFDVQLIGGAVLHQGKISEMVTGEGKTLVATLAAYLNALSGIGVHVVTVNDYLARRDRLWMGPIHEALGLTVGVIQSDMSSADRKVNYACDITYGQNNEFGFDYLRDNMKISAEDQAQKRRHFAIVDEVDSILIDEARTPLIISGPAEESTSKYYDADRVVRKLVKDVDFEVKEKENAAILTDSGMEKAEGWLGIESIYDGRNLEWEHHLRQALRAHHLYKRDHHYVCKDGEIIIVDEFTGRLMQGRRWSDGLHQAIEAKEGLKIQEENQTLATITFQNFFKLYDKISGMTGTAMTEAAEFDKIYKLDVVSIPTNRPLIRTNHPDRIYSTVPEKWSAVVDEIERVHRTGRPILVGTVSIENSEKISGMLQRRGIPHEVLNAKHHEREAYIVARAGQLGNVTIATNMAGRGTDILLGKFGLSDLAEFWQAKGLLPRSLKTDRPEPELRRSILEHLAEEILGLEDPSGLPDAEIEARLRAFFAEREEDPPLVGSSVAELGGLHIVGSERHEARRIDNQLRGRSGRQGDPGSSRFFLSLDDDVMRIFARDWVKGFLQRLGMRDGQDITSPMVSRAIERAQKKVEAHNFEIRKNLLEYDEVMNEQRKVVYGMRQNVLVGESQKERMLDMAWSAIDKAVRQYADPRSGGDEPDLAGLISWFEKKFGIALPESDVKNLAPARALDALFAKVEARYGAMEAEMGAPAVRAIEKFVLLQTIDTRWKDHLYAMDQLKEGIGLRGYAQVDPKLEYKKEGYRMFEEMMDLLTNETTDLIFKVRLTKQAEEEVRNVWKVSEARHDEVARPSREMQEASEKDLSDEKPKPFKREERKVGRNEPCPCGSGKKYKKCCGQKS
ncbi:MAG: preprotein translocase subunit SecA [Planctomycetes bacterium]|jgi:preprotein translocase subunit SecA|nr:preprotein translocase subunit SecA [Planctomycetota bacterium]